MKKPLSESNEIQAIYAFRNLNSPNAQVHLKVGQSVAINLGPGNKTSPAVIALFNKALPQAASVEELEQSLLDIITDAAYRRVKALEKEQFEPSDFQLVRVYLAMSLVTTPLGAKEWHTFQDYEVHRDLERKNIQRAFKHDNRVSKREVFVTMIESVDDSVRKLQNGRRTPSSSSVGTPVTGIVPTPPLTGDATTTDSAGVVHRITSLHQEGHLPTPPPAPKVLRKPQEDCVRFLEHTLKNGTVEKPAHALVNAIMRFGKTFTVLTYSKRFDKILILTHMPTGVSESWFEEAKAVAPDHTFISRKYGEPLEDLEMYDKVIVFLSLQDARGARTTTAEYKKHGALFGATFNVLLTDEAHEGASTELAEWVYQQFKFERHIAISGTPYSIAQKYIGATFNFSYGDERTEMMRFSKEHPGEVNPYGLLPAIEFRAIELSEVIKAYPRIEGSGFDFSMFFSTTSDGGQVRFQHDSDIRKFLDLMSNADGYPYSPDERGQNHHTIWCMPGTKSAKAMAAELKLHPHFKDYEVIVVSGDSPNDPLGRVKYAIANKDKTITLTVRRLTTGTTIPEWTSVIMLSNMSQATGFMQAAFRGKTQYEYPLLDETGNPVLDDETGEVVMTFKDKCVVYDFDPDRLIQVVSEQNALEENGLTPEKRKIRESLGLTEETISNFAPVLSYSGGQWNVMSGYQIDMRLKRIAVANVVQSGMMTRDLFDHNSIDASGLDTPEEQEHLLKVLSKMGSVKSDESKALRLSESGLSELKVQKVKDNDVDSTSGSETSGRENDPVENERKAAQKELRKRRNSIIMRIWVMLARAFIMVIATNPGDFANLSKGDSKAFIEQFPEMFDDASWLEYMQGITKDDWLYLSRFIKLDLFEQACRQVWDRVDLIQKMPVRKSAHEMRGLIRLCRNPDKETVLTPLEVVAMHYDRSVGGLAHLDVDGKFFCSDGVGRTWNELEEIEQLDSEEVGLAPRYIDTGFDDLWRKPDVRVLDVNAKTGLYSLTAALTIFEHKIAAMRGVFGEVTPEIERFTWEEIVRQNIFAIAKTQLAADTARKLLSLGRTDLADSLNVVVADVYQLQSHMMSTLRAGKKYSIADNLGTMRVLTQWVFDPAEWGTAQDRIDELVSMTAEELREKASGMTEKRMFDMCVGNPPYQRSTAQKETDGQETVTNVFHYFDMAARSVADVTALIYPGGRWLQRSGKGMKEWANEQMNSSSLLKVIYFPQNNQPFKDATINDGVSIVVHDQRSSNEGQWELVRVDRKEETSTFVSLPGDSPVSLSPFETSIINKVWSGPQRNYSLDRRGFLQKLFAIESSFVEGNTDKVVLCNDTFSNSPGEGWVRALLNDKSGSAGRTRWYWMLVTDIPASRQLIPKWKLIVSSAQKTIIGLSGSPHAEVLPPGTAFGRSRLGVAFFDTEEEARNFYKWMSTDFIRTLLASTGDSLTSFAGNVPDPQDFTTGGTSGLDFTVSRDELNTQLCDKYGLTEEERSYCAKTAASLAPFSRVEAQ